MNKTIKRTLAIVMAVAMLFALSVVAFAAQPDQTNSYTVTAYLKLQTATVSEGDSWDYVLGDLTNVNPLTNGFVQVEVTQNTPITVKDIVNKFLADNNISVSTCSHCDATYGCIHARFDEETEATTQLCTCANCACTWVRVQDMDSSFNPISHSYSSVLNSITYNSISRTNTYSYEPEGDYTRYTGTSWEYFVANSATGTDVYPNSYYMDEYVISGTQYITVSFDHTTFIF